MNAIIIALKPCFAQLIPSVSVEPSFVFLLYNYYAIDSTILCVYYSGLLNFKTDYFFNNISRI